MGPVSALTLETATHAVNSSLPSFQAFQYCRSWCHPTLTPVPDSVLTGGLERSWTHQTCTLLAPVTSAASRPIAGWLTKLHNGAIGKLGHFDLAQLVRIVAGVPIGGLRGNTCLVSTRQHVIHAVHAALHEFCGNHGLRVDDVAVAQVIFVACHGVFLLSIRDLTRPRHSRPGAGPTRR